MKKLILLVDDEEIIRMTSGEILEGLGFEVITAGNGKEGLEIFKAKQDEISLIILDVTLPDISGMELFNEINKINSNVKFLFTSGYTKHMAGVGNESAFIQKPYTMTELGMVLTGLIG